MDTRQRYDEVRRKLAGGEVRDANDLITLNLDIRQFAQDVIEHCEGPELLRALWHAVEQVTVLDLTCGSGAFLFAALNILEPLYEGCLQRMEAFVEDLDRSGVKHRPEKFSDFRKVLAHVAAHPNHRYFIFKSIILRNLYGVDIMEEAVEICKLRLFLKLAAQVEPDSTANNLGIEPLPDVDFNIKAGNTLVGFATLEAFKRAAASRLQFDDAAERVDVKAADLQQSFDRFRARQVEGDSSVPVEDKQELRKRLEDLDDELNRYLAVEYGIDPPKGEPYAKWLKSHQPFHWFVEFYGIMNGGGFDVIVGNPPYVEYSRSNVDYRVLNLTTATCDNLWAFVLERSRDLLSLSGRMSLITPLSLASTGRFTPAYNLLVSNTRCTTFLTLSGDAHPSVLFSGVKMSFVIFTYAKASQQHRSCKVYMSKLFRWLSSERDALFSLAEYHPALPPSSIGIPFKVGSAPVARIVEGVNLHREKIATLERKRGVPMLYHRIVRHFIKALFTVPYFSNERDGEKRSEDYKLVLFEDEATARLIRSFLVSSTFYVFFVALSDAYHCGRDLVLAFPVGITNMRQADAARLIAIGAEHERDLFRHSVRRRIRYAATGWIEYDEFYPRESKLFADQIDMILARHYGFTETDLDFIINYDIKYRMGRDAEDGEEM